MDINKEQCAVEYFDDGSTTIKVPHNSTHPVDCVRLDTEDPGILWIHCPRDGCGWFTAPVPPAWLDRYVNYMDESAKLPCALEDSSDRLK